MDFYYVHYNQEKYELTEAGQVAITENQLFNIVEGVSQLYREQSDLLLRIRTYITIYYDNDTMEYVSLESSPSQLLSKERREVRGMGNVGIDGFATTFLEGELENRIWFGVDGAIENRGPSGELVRVLLMKIVDQLNDNEKIESTRWQRAIDKRIIENELPSLHELLKGEMNICDRNQQEVCWVIANVHGEEKVIPLGQDMFQIIEDVSEWVYPIITKDGLCQLKYKKQEGLLSLSCIRYPWQSQQYDIDGLVRCLNDKLE